jgi:hypothetical protein
LILREAGVEVDSDGTTVSGLEEEDGGMLRGWG